MKRTLLALAAAILLIPTTGCLHHNTAPPEGHHASGGCGPGGCGGDACGGLLGGFVHGSAAQALHANRGWRHQPPEMGPAGPPTGTVAYPYYTLRGPRDFLVNNPPSIGN